MTLELIDSHQVFGGQQMKYRHTSSVLNSEMTFSLFLPTAATDQGQLSLVWWLSGLTCTDDNFSQKGGFQRFAAESNLAFVMPDTSPRGDAADSEDWDLGQGAGFYLNATQAPWQQHYQMYDYLTLELPEIIYGLIPNFSGKESIMGHSMGGHGALILGLKNPQRFAAVSAFAPIMSPTDVPWGQKAFTAYLGDNQDEWLSWDATKLLEAGNVQSGPILITQGTADNFYEVQLQEKAFLAAAKQNGSDVRYHSEEGYDHSYFTIATFIEEHINFHNQYLNP